MQVEIIFKVAAIGLVVAILNQMLTKSGKDEYSMMTTLAGMIVVIMMLINEISSLFEIIKNTFEF